MAGSRHPPTLLIELDSCVCGLMWQIANIGGLHRDAAALHFTHIACQQTQNTNTAFPPPADPSLIFHLAASEHSTLSGPTTLLASESGL